LVEGIRHVGEAVEAGAVVESIFFAPEILKSEFAAELVERQEKNGVVCYSLPADIFNDLTEKEHPQGILALVRQPEYRLEELKPNLSPWVVGLVSPQDPGNVGAILRTIDAVGASGLVVLDSGLDLFHPALVRASMGTLFWYPVIQAAFADFRAWAVEHAYHVYGSSAKADCGYLEARPYAMPRILLLGSEREGLSDEQRRFCERIVSLPMKGHASSLNLSVAAGVLLYAMQD
jgi:TrmH family RNA methyltransferase